jgi:NitT/TauT family transport system permease protein
MFDAMYRMAFEQDQRSGTYLLLNDTIASLKRLMVGVGCAAAVGLMVGLNVGLFPGLRVLLLPAITFVSIIPPLALLPILFIVFGVDELSKIVLIFIGVAPAITRDLYLTTSQIPTEQITKALTLGASTLGVVYQVILPQILPRLIEAVRLSLGAAWLFLIASEAIASTEGLGYRIFLVRRYLSMDVIIPYALWITFLGFLVDYALRVLLRHAYPWYSGGRQQ